MVINNVCNFGFGGDLSSSLGHTCTIAMFKYTRWLIKTGFSIRARAQAFPMATMDMSPGYFKKKERKGEPKNF